MQYETAITIKEYSTSTDNIPFLDLIVCPEYFEAYNTDKLQYYGMEKETYKFQGQYYPKNNSNGTEARNIFYEVTYDVEEIFDRIRINTLNKADPFIHIDFSKGNFNDHLVITPKFWNHFGRCFSILPKHDVRTLGIVDIIFEAKRSIFVYFGHPGQFEAANRNTKVIIFYF